MTMSASSSWTRFPFEIKTLVASLGSESPLKAGKLQFTCSSDDLREKIRQHQSSLKFRLHWSLLDKECRRALLASDQTSERTSRVLYVRDASKYEWAYENLKTYEAIYLEEPLHTEGLPNEGHPPSADHGPGSDGHSDTLTSSWGLRLQELVDRWWEETPGPTRGALTDLRHLRILKPRSSVALDTVVRLRDQSLNASDGLSSMAVIEAAYGFDWLVSVLIDRAPGVIFTAAQLPLDDVTKQVSCPYVGRIFSQVWPNAAGIYIYGEKATFVPEGCGECQQDVLNDEGFSGFLEDCVNIIPGSLRIEESDLQYNSLQQVCARAILDYKADVVTRSVRDPHHLRNTVLDLYPALCDTVAELSPGSRGDVDCWTLAHGIQQVLDAETESSGLIRVCPLTEEDVEWYEALQLVKKQSRNDSASGASTADYPH